MNFSIIKYYNEMGVNEIKLEISVAILNFKKTKNIPQKLSISEYRLNRLALLNIHREIDIVMPLMAL